VTQRLVEVITRIPSGTTDKTTPSQRVLRLRVFPPNCHAGLHHELFKHEMQRQP
jgi:hypothetical protein